MRQQPAEGPRDELPAPFLLVLFGATGDLAKRKLYAALYQMFMWGLLPAKWIVFGVSRTKHTDESFRQLVSESVGGADEEFLKHFVYFSTDAGDSSTYAKVAERAEKLALRKSLEQVTYYLSVMPSLYPGIVNNIRQFPVNGLPTKLMIEKPFGTSVAEVKTLDSLLESAFDAPNIFRIDHYLGKSMVGFLQRKRSNAAVGRLIDRNIVRGVRLDFVEPFGIGSRAGFFDGVGTVFDMWPHIIQTVAAITYRPIDGNGSHLQVRRAEIIRAIHVKRTLCAQYVESFNGVGYLDEKDVPKTSRTETFCAAHFTVDTPEWAGVPFVAVTGKCVGRSKYSRIAAAIDLDDGAFGGLTLLQGGSDLLSAEIFLDGGAPEKCVIVHNPMRERVFENAPIDGDHLCDYGELIRAALLGDPSFAPSREEIEAQTEVLERLAQPTRSGLQELETYGVGFNGAQDTIAPPSLKSLLEVLPPNLRAL